MQHLGRAQAIDDLDPEVGGEALAQLGGQGFASRGDQAQCGVLFGRQRRRGQHAGKTGGRAEEYRGTHAAHLATPAFERGLRCWPLGHQDGRGAHAQGEAQRIAQAIGKEKLGRREADVLLGEAEHGRAIELGRPVGVAMAVQRAFGLACGAGGVEPEAGVVRAGARRFGQWRVLRHQGVECHGALGQGGIRTRHDHGLDLVATLSQGRLQRGQQGSRHNGRLGPAVLQHVGVVVGGEQGVDGHRHDAGVHGAEKAHRPVAAVVHQQQHALFAPHARSQ